MSDETVEPAAPAADKPAEQPAADQAKTATEKKPAKAKDSKAKADKGKSKGKDKGKGKKSSGGVSVATHPRAHAAVRRAKGWGGLAGFAIAAYLSSRAGVPPEQIGLRALAAGAAGYMVAWATAVTIWRHLVLAELRAHYESRPTPAPAIPIKSGNTGPNEDRRAPGLTK